MYPEKKNLIRLTNHRLLIDLYFPVQMTAQMMSGTIKEFASNAFFTNKFAFHLSGIPDASRKVLLQIFSHL